MPADTLGALSPRSVDITSDADIQRLMAEVGAFDHLVFTARSRAPATPFLALETAAAQQAFETKFWGQYRVIKAAAPHLNPHGSITLTSGIASLRPFPGLSTMSAINGATESLCKALAVELAPLRVNTVSPGFVETTNAQIREMAAALPLKSLGTTEAIARNYLFLMSDAYTTGTVLVCDGGAMLV
ncbi:MAG TPA: short-chain dehydrogenase [Betaproteobacteria bacterium]|nr:short-chain dehydrogenase [Betaproteobacteria bacterium]